MFTGSIMRTAKELFQELQDQDPELRREYDRLAPRFTLIDALVKARKQRRLTQRELAERIGVTKTVISRVESGKHSPRLEMAYDIAKAIGLRLDIKLVEDPTAHGTDSR